MGDEKPLSNPLIWAELVPREGSEGMMNVLDASAPGTGILQAISTGWNWTRQSPGRHQSQEEQI